MDVWTLLASAAATTQSVDAGLFSVASLIALFTLTALEIVLGIDNVVFISLLVNKLPPEKRNVARKLGLGLAMGMRILLLLTISWIMGLTKPLHTPINAFWTDEAGDTFAFTGKDLVLLIGGLFLLWKSTHEIHHKLEGAEHEHANDPAEGASAGTIAKKAAVGFGAVIVQILLIDIVFSLDSVITAVGMAQHLPVMIAAVVISVIIMMLFSGHVAALIQRHPTLQMLALSFLILIGMMLIVDSFHVHVPKGYIYFAMAFSLVVELLNIRARKKTAPVKLREGGFGA
ncbi:MAG: TerC family protein [Tepidisphaeraceae bacterium]